MKVLVVCSATSGKVAPFIDEQVESLRNNHVVADFLLIKKNGLLGYLQAYFKLLKKTYRSDYDLVHAHYGLAGFISVFQFFKPVVVTFHGCDINDRKTRLISKIAYKLSSQAIFVEKEMAAKINALKKATILPCGVNLTVFYPVNKEDARASLNLPKDKNFALFSSSFDTPVKNSELAKAACREIAGLELVEMKNFTRAQVNLFLNACDLLILTSLREGSPQVIKEALATNCPIVSVNVGDVPQKIGNVDNAFITTYSKEDIVKKMEVVLTNNKRTNGAIKVKDLDLDSVACQIVTIYKKTIR